MFVGVSLHVYVSVFTYVCVCACVREKVDDDMYIILRGQSRFSLALDLRLSDHH